MGALRRIVLALLAATLLPVLVLRWIPPPTSAFMLAARVSAFLEDDRQFRLRYQWVPWEEISPAMKLAVIAAEDQRFGDHFGFDWNAMAQAWQHNQRGLRPRGASTLSQQTAKNLFLCRSRSYLRKAAEAYFTVLLEAFWPKRRILEIYLNIAQFGKGIYGVSEASRAYFRKPASQLLAREAALLAAVLPNPILLRVDQPSPYLLKRRLWILRQMRQLGGTAHLAGL
ncbi:monofunctional biosynthetic peptidoglycan transglycosylase [Candidatus Methylocalor cossyra]|uniref:Biosynthetic peptidoglycan transglycosylase n=1 Tax=Candidatus Methylocalor cossyra TaxID=3108543 RepID=A0ABP1CBX4_9GAMM